MVGPSSPNTLPGHPPIRLPRRVSGGSLEVRLYMGQCPVCWRPVQIRIAGSSGAAWCRCGSESFRCHLPPLVWHARAYAPLTVVASTDSASVLEFLRDLDIAPRLLQRMSEAYPLPLHCSSVLPSHLSPLLVGPLLQHWRFRTEGRPEPWRVQSLSSRLRAVLSARLRALGSRLRKARRVLLHTIPDERFLHGRLLAHVIVLDPTGLPVTLNADDLALASRWPMKPRESEENHLKRTRAARAAERAVASYYSRLFPTASIADVALGQIRPPPPSNWSWKDCDIDRDGVPVDVKNVRQIERPGAGVYAEWFAKDKPIDGPSSEIVIAATITRPCDTGSAGWQVPRFASSLIGEWTPADQASLREWRSPFLDDAQLTWTGRPTRPEHLSGWLLEFPAAHYRPLTPALTTACVEAWKIAGKSEFSLVVCRLRSCSWGNRRTRFHRPGAPS